MEVKTLNWKTLIELLSTRLLQLLSSPGYWGYAIISLILVGGVGVWAPQVFDISTERDAVSFAFLTYGFAVTNGMLLDMMLARDRNVELSLVGTSLVLVAFILLLNPFYRVGPSLWFSYSGTGLIVLVWVLANIDAYVDKLPTAPKAAVGGDVDDGISGAGLNIHD